MIKIVILAFVILLLSWAGGMVKKEYSVLLGLCGMVLIFSIGLKAVSYTHLDVYKRQLLYG